MCCFLSFRLSTTRQDRDLARAVERLMASKTNATPQKEEVPKKEGPETSPDSPLLDLSDAAVKKLILSAKKRGYVTHDQISALLFSEEVKSEQIEDLLAMFSEMGVNVVETEEAEPEDEGARKEPDDDEETPCVFSFMRWPTISPTSCGRWLCRRRSSSMPFSQGTWQLRQCSRPLMETR